MSKFNYKKIMPRYSFIAIVMAIIAMCVLGKALYIMTAKRDYWLKVADRVKRDSVIQAPVRGNILSCDGQLLASSLPVYKLYMDFNALHESKTDTLWNEKVDSISNGLHAIFPERSAQEFRSDLEKGRKKNSRHWPIWKGRVSYNVYTEVKMLPILNMPSYRGGFHVEEFNARQKPFGGLASRTLGILYGAKDTARYGLELSYDSILRGKNGIYHRRKVLNKFLNITDTPPVDGADIVTTIDVGIQDLAERALIDMLKQKDVHGDVGVAIVMDVKTGDIKAMVNLDKCADGEYREVKNHAVSDLLEPGSVFKPVSIMTVLEDGYCDTTKMVDTGAGKWEMYGSYMKDWNWTHGGYGLISLPRTLEVSSNIGVSRIIDEYYHNNPEKFVKGIYRTGIADSFKIPIPGASAAVIRMPKKNKHGQWVNWSNTALPWMSIGYETQIPPLSTLAFYNAIANNGRMMRPRLVKQVVKDGKVIAEFPPEVMPGREHICSDRTLKLMQTILTHVVSQGLGRKAGSTSFKVAGKTGTAQIAQGGGYRTGAHYLLSFAGYFPADAPRYSCIVCIQKYGLPASGGGMSGVVFHHIAEGIMAKDVKLDVIDARDSTSILVPDVKNGNVLAADYVLSHLGINTNTDWSGTYSDGNPIWGKAEKQQSNRSVMLVKEKQYGRSYMPNVIGMGARDAVYLIESRGVKVVLTGRGKVVEQSLEPGHKIHKGERCRLKLQ